MAILTQFWRLCLIFSVFGFISNQYVMANDGDGAVSAAGEDCEHKGEKDDDGNCIPIYQLNCEGHQTNEFLQDMIGKHHMINPENGCDTCCYCTNRCMCTDGQVCELDHEGCPVYENGEQVCQYEVDNVMPNVYHNH